MVRRISYLSSDFEKCYFSITVTTLVVIVFQFIAQIDIWNF